MKVFIPVFTFYKTRLHFFKSMPLKYHLKIHNLLIINVLITYYVATPMLSYKTLLYDIERYSKSVKTGTNQFLKDKIQTDTSGVVKITWSIVWLNCHSSVGKGVSKKFTS